MARPAIPRQKIIDYFEPDPEAGPFLEKDQIGRVVAIAIAGVLFTCAYGLGLLILAGLGGWLWWKHRRWTQAKKDVENEIAARTTDQQIDRWMKMDRDAIPESACGKGGIGPEDLVGEKFILVYGPRLGKDVSLRYRKGRDNVVRFSHYVVSVLMFTDSQLLVYQCVLDHTTGRALNESISEFFYRFVSGVSIECQAVEVRIDGWSRVLQFNASRTFVLTVSGAPAVRVTLGDTELLQELGEAGSEIATSDIETAMRGIRRMIREKHQT